MSYILHIERRWNGQHYKFKMEVPAETRKKALEMFNEVADRSPGESKLISCRLVREDIDPDNPDAE